MARPIGAETLGLAGSACFELEGSLPPPPRLAVVGSRACHLAHAGVVSNMVAAAGELGFSLVSGGALGVDALAHAAALAHEVPQLAVLPCGSDRPYPPAHAGLFARILGAAGSGLLYAQPRGRVPSRSMFASRNRIVVALARAVVVVEAASRSGSVGTGRSSLALGVPTAVLPGSRGCAALAAEGAFRLPLDAGVRALEAALRSWLDGVVAGRPPAPPRKPWPARLGWLREAIERRDGRGVTLDELPDRLAAAVALTEAETLGLVHELAPGRYAET